jgi:toxin ParE1/3/4
VKIEYSELASADLLHIEQYYAERTGLDFATVMRRRLRSTLELLVGKNPRIGRARPDISPDTRSFPVLPYVVFYRVERRRIFVLRIIHGHRDIRPPLASLLTAV